MSQIVNPGIFVLDGDMFKVQPNKAKTKVYAKKLVIIKGDRLNQVGDRVNFEYEYAPGIVYKLTEEHRMTKAQAEKFGLQYGRCAWCGRGLKQADSVERGIGPVCFGKFA